MRTSMFIISIITVGVGTFCISNAGIPFTSVGFLIGLVAILLGVCELIVGRTTAMRGINNNFSGISPIGVTEVILGVVFLSSQITEDVTVLAVFALWTTIIGLTSVTTAGTHFNENTRSYNGSIGVGGATILIGIYAFFNISLLNLPVLTVIGVCLFALGLNCFISVVLIEYKKPKLIMDHDERIREAEREEKHASQRAKMVLKEVRKAKSNVEKLKAEKEQDEKNAAVRKSRKE